VPKLPIQFRQVMMMDIWTMCHYFSSKPILPYVVTSENQFEFRGHFHSFPEIQARDDLLEGLAGKETR